jgi:membrane protein implicated in regulation of membrane protease activity
VPGWFASLSAFTVFLGIAGVGFLFLLVSLVFGEIFEHLGDDLDHDLDHGGPGIFSTRILSVFVTAFGGFGAVATYYGASPVSASAVGFASGVLFASIIYGFARFLWSQQAATELRSADLVGQVARVVVAIPKGGLGQVRCRLGEELLDKIARSQDGEAIAENEIVRIEQVLGETVIVRKQAGGA